MTAMFRSAHFSHSYTLLFFLNIKGQFLFLNLIPSNIRTHYLD